MKNKDHLTGQFDSWTIHSETLASKKCDKSVFEFNNSGIPREIYWFFNAQELKPGEKRDVMLQYNGKPFEAYIVCKNDGVGRVQIRWFKDLAEEIEDNYNPNDWPLLTFEREENYRFVIYFENEEKLSAKAIEVAEALLKLITNRQRVITYRELSNMTESKPSAFYEMHGILDSINKHCDLLGLPHISAMVVNKKTGLPGEGFRALCIDEFGYDEDMSLQEIFDAELDKIAKCDSWDKLAESIGLQIPNEEEDFLPEEVIETEGETLVEGAKKQITVNAYERDPKAKKKCKDFYMKRDGRITCQVCGFNFGEVYGPEYANKIHIHHIIPISEIGEEYEVDPINDLIPVCPNCHMVLHAGKGISVEALKKKMRNKRH